MCGHEIGKQQLIENRQRLGEVIRPPRVVDRNMIRVHELPLDRVRRFVSEDAHVVVRTGKAIGEKDAVHADSALAEAARFAIWPWGDVHPAIRRIEKRAKLAGVVTERSDGGEDGLASLIDRELRIRLVRRVIGAKVLVAFVNAGVRRDAF